MKKFLKKIKYLFEYISYKLFSILLFFIGFKRSADLCAFLLKKICPYLKVHKIAKRNMIMTINPSNVDELLAKCLDHYGRYFAEFIFMSRLTEKEIKKRIIVENLDLIRPYKEKNQPVIFCLAHLGNWDFLIDNIDIIYPKLAVIYRKANNPYIDKEMLLSRKNKYVKMIAKGRSGAADLLNAVKEGRSLVMLIDQKMNEGIEVPFLGKPAMTASAIAKLSLKFKLPIVPLKIIRTKGSYFRATIYQPIFYKKTDNNHQDIYNIMLKLNNIVSGWIKDHPEQWFWFHNRWDKL